MQIFYISNILSSSNLVCYMTASNGTFTLLPNNIEEVHAFWIAGGSCDGCSIAAVGATSPSVEELLRGVIPGVPKVVLHHPVLSVVAGEEFIKQFRLAARGELGAPFVVICEG